MRVQGPTDSLNRCGVSVHHLGFSEGELFGVGMIVRVSGDSLEVEVENTRI
jgi:hypothetical protein